MSLRSRGWLRRGRDTCSFGLWRDPLRAGKRSSLKCWTAFRGASGELLVHALGSGTVPVADPAGHTGGKLGVDW